MVQALKRVYLHRDLPRATLAASLHPAQCPPLSLSFWLNSIVSRSQPEQVEVEQQEEYSWRGIPPDAEENAVEENSELLRDVNELEGA